MNRDLTEPRKIFAFAGVGARVEADRLVIGEFHRWRPGSYLLGWGSVLAVTLANYFLAWRPGAPGHGDMISLCASIAVEFFMIAGLIFGHIMFARRDGVIAVFPRSSCTKENVPIRFQRLHVRTGRCGLRAARTHQFWQLFAVYETQEPGMDHEPVYRYLFSAGERLYNSSPTLRRLSEGGGCEVTLESLEETLRFHGTIIVLPSFVWKRVVLE